MGEIHHKYLRNKHLAILCVLFVLTLLVGSPYMGKSFLSNGIPSCNAVSKSDITTVDIGPYDVQEEILIADIQDRIDTIDQAGLYVLLDHADKDISNSSAIILDISPYDLRDNPAEYRGGVTHFNIFVDPIIKIAPLGRSSRSEIKYVNAQIKTSDKKRIPAIILLPRGVIQSIVDKMAVTGYFCMILRAETEEPDPKTGRKQLDYIVLAATELVPQDNSQSTKPRNKIAIATLTMLITVSIWIVLRFRIRKYKGTRQD